MVTLDTQATLYVPSLNGRGAISPAKRDRVVAGIQELFSSAFGGATTTHGTGAWQGERGLVYERVTLIQAFTTPDTLETWRPALLIFAEWLRDYLEQEAVALRLGNTLCLV